MMVDTTLGLPQSLWPLRSPKWLLTPLPPMSNERHVAKFFRPDFVPFKKTSQSTTDPVWQL